jgi:hypothetical protein
VDLLLAGLNYQIDHHLFASMLRPVLRRAQPLVAEFFATRGIRFTETGLLSSHRIGLSHLSGVAAGTGRGLLIHDRTGVPSGSEGLRASPTR